jgi:hypothetical protein
MLELLMLVMQSDKAHNAHLYKGQARNNSSTTLLHDAKASLASELTHQEGPTAA